MPILASLTGSRAFGMLSYLPAQIFNYLSLTGSSGYTEFAMSISKDLSGASYTSGTISGPGTSRGVVIKSGPDGSISWQKSLGHATTTSSFYDTVPVDGGIVAGGELYDGNTRPYLLAKFTSAGELSWQKSAYSTIGNIYSNSSLNRLATDSAGNIYATGWGETSIDGNGASGCMLLKYSGDGVLQWGRFVKTEASNGTAICVDSSGYIWVAQTAIYSPQRGFIHKYSSDGVLQFQKSLNNSSESANTVDSLISDGSGNLYVTLSGDAPQVVKLDSTGAIVWQKQFASLQGSFEGEYH